MTIVVFLVLALFAEVPFETVRANTVGKAWQPGYAVVLSVSLPP